MSASVITAGIVFFLVIVALVSFDFHYARRREQRIVSETAASVKEVRDRADANLLETRKRTDAYQERLVKILEEHNTLLREIPSELKNKSS